MFFLFFVFPVVRIVNVSSLSSETVYTEMSEEVKGRFQAVKTEQDVEQLMEEYVEYVHLHGMHIRYMEKNKGLLNS